ncbi:dihydrofolate reductase-like domain-containing protein [Aspergillus crustosus]
MPIKPTPYPWKTRLFFATSLDGFIARPNNDITWLTNPPKNPSHTPATPSPNRQTLSFEQHIAEVDVIVMGRVTYEVCRGFGEWPYPAEKRVFILSRKKRAQDLREKDRDEDEDEEQDMDWKNLNPGPNENQFVSSIEEVEELLTNSGTNMVYVDGGEVCREFLRRGWVDEMVVTRAPVLLGEGRPLFGTEGVGDVRFTLKGVDVIEDGMVSCHYVKVEDEGPQ